MPNAAHTLFETELKAALAGAFDEIDDYIGDGDDWVPVGCFEEGPQDCEWESRDGFWSHNNGGLEMTFYGTSSLLYSGYVPPCLKEWVDDFFKEVKEAALEDEDYLEWANENPGRDVGEWLRDTNDGNNFENDYEYSYLESPPFANVKAWIQSPDRYQYTGPVGKDTRLLLHFEVCFNDDLGYNRPGIAWCRGVGDHPKCEADIFFTAGDVAEVREIIKTKLVEMGTGPDDEVQEKVTFYTKNYGK